MKCRHFLVSLTAITLGGAAFLVALPTFAEPGKFSLASGFDYSSGKYGTNSTTSILSIPVIGKYASGHWLFKLTTPLVRTSGAPGVVPGMGRIKAKGTTTSSQFGLGDTVAAASYSLTEQDEAVLGVDVTGKIKLATASPGLGSGANDYAMQMDVYQSLGNFTAMSSLGSKFLGSSSGASLTTVIYGSLGGAYQLTKQTSGGIDLSLAQSPAATTARQQEVMAYLSYKIDRHYKAQGYVLKGFADGSPDSGLGALIVYGF